jgi:magnesium transporter
MRYQNPSCAATKMAATDSIGQVDMIQTRKEQHDEPLAETAARHMVRRVPTTSAATTADAALLALRGQTFDSVDALCVIDADGRLQGIVPAPRLLSAPGPALIAEIMRRDPPRCRPDTDQEHVATMARRHRISSVPVVDDGGRLLGVVPALAIIDVLRREHIEDLHRLAGIVRETDHALGALEEPPVRRLRHRLPWLIVGLIGSVLATVVVMQFEAALNERVAIAFFIPAIVYLADAIGTQTETITVRGLLAGLPPFRRLLAGELGAGLLIGLVLGGLAMPTVWLAFGDPWLALTVGLAILVAGTIATSVGLVFPWLLARFGADPAFGSGPVATIIQDVLSLLTYFVVASVLL